MFHVRLGGSNGTTKDKDARFVPIHPRIRPLIAALPKNGDQVFPDVHERQLLKRVKELCGTLNLAGAKAFKLHSFRHHFASMCANHQVAYRKALAWLGHSDSSILQLYYHLTDNDSQAAMEALAGDGFRAPELKPETAAVEGNLRATGQSTIEKLSQSEAEQNVKILLGTVTERGRFELPRRFKPPTAFPVLLLQPLGHLSRMLLALASGAVYMRGRSVSMAARRLYATSSTLRKSSK